ncbi:uncharacterized protein LOC143240984 isoform X1 [Tachypleus tridentatus]|uniref:uncharacterized protein LOC143240984 isoform X1 n=1 Tax=Tachypleus tridentatus TaxID=6853 RepID=UPI003FD36DFC
MASDSKKIGKSHDLFHFGFMSKTNESKDNTTEPRVKSPSLLTQAQVLKQKTVTASIGAKPTRRFQDEWNRGRPWLEYNNTTRLMFRSVCQEYDQSSGKQKNTFITGSSNLRESDVKEHENSHTHSLSCQAKTAKETPDLTPTMKELSKLNQTEKDHLLVLFRTALYMALNVKPFSDFQELLLLQ